MMTSRDEFLAQLERCVRYQNEHITLPDPPRSDETVFESSPFIPEDPTGNGQPRVDVERETVWGLRPPGEDSPPPPETVVGDWA